MRVPILKQRDYLIASIQSALSDEDLLQLRVIDEILPEPPGGAHADPEAAAATLSDALKRQLAQLRKVPVDKLLRRREEKYLSMGALSPK